MRVSEITLFRENQVIDTWHYIYGPNGRRAAKDIAKPGHRPHVRLLYDEQGKRIKEVPLNVDGQLEPKSVSSRRAVRRRTRSSS